ncbi:NAD(P)-binding protein [Periconia macrospinosa]|uniref:NAD(P)-binding protein n=1 Tax=Periconia macrospinosa TaxID=97972 RepID=A0A2V1DJG3_9PLEO|nr:NAD(P)-binding protein [Periconia macrospinosa]
MVSWAVTGATRGIGFGFVDNLSSDSNNQVFALIRSRSSAGPLEELAAKRGNIHIVVTDIADPKKLEEAAAEVSKVTAGALDVLILNAGSAVPETSGLPPTAFHGKKEALENEVNENIKNNLFSNIFVIEAFLELIRKGTEKKIAFVSSSSGDVEFTRITGISAVLGYSIAKAGMNMVMTKYAVELANEGIRTLSMSPGWVATDAAEAVTGDPEIRKFFLNAFHKLDPTVTGPIPVETSVAAQLKLVKNLTAEDSGKFVTHNGNSEWF